MERRLSLNYLLLGLLAGLALGSAWQVLPSRAWLAPWFVISLFLLLLYIRRHWPLWGYGAACLWGLCWATGHGHQLYAKRLPETLAGSDWWMEAVVTGLPERTTQGERFDVQVERVLQGPHASDPLAFYPGKVRLSYYRERGVAAGDDFYFQPGQRWQLWLRLKPPRGLVNQNNFDYEGWLLQQGYHATGYVRDLVRAKRLPDQVCDASRAGLRACVDKSAFKFLQWINRHVEPGHRALFAALTIGYGEDFDRAQWDVLRNTGTIHLVVVSGFHISMMAVVGYALFALLARFLLLPLWGIPAPLCGASGAVLLAIFYAVISGFTLPVQRALVMVLCGLGVWFLRTGIPVFTAVLLAAVLVFVLDPLAWFSSSFWLSFGAVAVLLYVFSGRTGSGKDPSLLSLWLKTQVCISIGMVPLLAYGIGSVPVNTPLANLLAVPYVTFVILPLVLLVLVFSLVSDSMSLFLLAVTHHSMDFFWWLLRQFEKINYTIYFSSSDVWPWSAIVFAILAVMVILAPGGIFYRRSLQWLLAICLALPLFWPWREKIPAGEFLVTVLDVGQGLSVLVETENNILVYDTGDKFSEQFDIGRDLVAQQIQRNGYEKIHTLVISHGDSDHAGGLEGVLSRLPVERALGGEEKLGLELCQAGQHWRVDGVDFYVLSPDSAVPLRKSNNRSCVVKVAGTHHSLLLSGDIHGDQEQWLLAHVAPAMLDSDVLLVPHHGSKSSSTAAFIERVSPAIALVSVGYHSRYGHPHGEIRERYRQHGIPLLRTDLGGALSLSSVDRFRYIQQARWQSGRYWHRW